MDARAKQIKEFCEYCRKQHLWFHRWKDNITKTPVGAFGLAKSTIQCLETDYQAVKKIRLSLTYYEHISLGEALMKVAGRKLGD